MNSAGHSTYQPAPGISWAVIASGILIIDHWGHRSRRLDYPSAALWDWLAQGRSIQETAALMLQLQDPADNKSLDIDELVFHWRADGWIIPIPPGG
jgi:hypothetical protein